MRETHQSSYSQPPPSPSPLLRDISNFKTPKHSLQNPNSSNPPSPLPLFFTATKQSPFASSSTATAFRRHPAIPPSSSKSKAVRRLKAFELEQSQSSRKVQIRREKTINTLSRSLTSWLNFLFENPKSCGCAVAAWDEEERSELVVSGKRDSLEGRRVGIDRPWRSPKRQRNCSSLSAAAASNAETSPSLGPSAAAFLPLETSLKDVCSLEDLKERMKICLSMKNQNELLSMMTQVTKNIDEGRLKMKAHCPLVIDVGMKEKATKILMSYNNIWLRVGLHIVFGGDSLLATEDGSLDQNDQFLKMVIEKQFFTHPGLAKSYAYNKMVEGLYRPGYFEALGSIILKRFLLLVIVLDRAKCQSSLPTKYGIDGTDGGSPLLFTRRSGIKSSRQIIHEFLSPVMHGEGDLLAHLAIIGYKVSHQQCTLAEFDFRVTDLFEDFQDGIRLCRAVQLLQRDASILTKVMVPSDTRKKNLLNCGVAMQYLKQAGVPLSDEDGTCIAAEDVENGDKELILSLLWNIFVHLQIPLLINKLLLVEEMSKVKGSVLDLSTSETGNHLDMILEWIQAICENYHLKVDNFASLCDGKALCFLFDYYFKNELHGNSYFKDAEDTSNEESILSKNDNTVVLNNFILVQRVTTMLGNFPEILQISDILENDPSCNERSVIILLIFLSSQLIGRRNTDQLKIHKLMGWKNHIPDAKSNMSPFANNSATVQPVLRVENADLSSCTSSAEKAFLHLEETMESNEGVRYSSEDVVKKIRIIQCWWRMVVKKRHDNKVNHAIYVVKEDARCHLSDQHDIEIQRETAKQDTGCHLSDQHHNETRREWAANVIQAHFKGSIERRNYLRVKSATTILQSAVQAWLTATRKKSANGFGSSPCSREFFTGSLYLTRSSYIISHDLQILLQSVLKLQRWWRRALFLKSSTSSAIIIQSHFRRWAARQEAKRKRHSLVVLQKSLAAIKIQSCCRAWLIRRYFLHQRESIAKIQRYFRFIKCFKTFQQYKVAAIEIQRFARGLIARNKLLGASPLCYKIRRGQLIQFRGTSIPNLQMKILLHSVVKLQRWWRGVMDLKSRTKSAVIIQSYVRGWVARCRARKERHRIIVIQSYWKGYHVRKGSREQLVPLRQRLQKSASNVDNSMRLMSRLVAALSQLLSDRVSNILHTCATLDMATGHSEKCCETLVTGGAIGALLNQIHAANRSAPCQEVRKHALSTLRNLGRYRHLAEVLINTPGSVETIFQELLRNKDDGYFIAADLLKKLCSREEGIEAIHKLPAYLKRLNNLAEDLERKLNLEKRNPRLASARENTERRLREAVQLLHLAANC